MDWHYEAGRVAALEKMGQQLHLPWTVAEKVKNFIKAHPRLVIGGAIGTPLAARTLFSNKEPSPRMEPPIIEGNPLYSNIHE